MTILAVALITTSKSPWIFQVSAIVHSLHALENLVPSIPLLYNKHIKIHHQHPYRRIDNTTVPTYRIPVFIDGEEEVLGRVLGRLLRGSK